MRQRPVVLKVTVLISVLIVSCSVGAKRKIEQAVDTPDLKRQEKKPEMTIAELKTLYKAAKSEFERRTICLQAIDQGAFFRPGPVSSIDEIFGTHFAAKLPTRQEGRRTGTVEFALAPPVLPSADGRHETAPGSKGWFMAIEYDYTGEIQNYYLTNLDL